MTHTNETTDRETVYVVPMSARQIARAITLAHDAGLID